MPVDRTRWNVAPLERSRRGVDERLLMLIPAVSRVLVRLVLSQSLGSPLRRAVLTRIVRVGIAANNRDDYEAMSAFFAPHIELHLSDDSGQAGLDLDPVYHGVGGYLRAVEVIKAGFASHRWEPREIFDSGGPRVAASIEEVARGRASGVETRMTMFHVWEFEGGHVARQHVLATEEAMWRILER